MVIVYYGKGVKEFKFLEPCLVDEELNNTLFTASKLLANRGKDESAQLLANLDFKLTNGTNEFHDKFLVLHASIPLDKYEQLRIEFEKVEGFEAYKKLEEPYFAIAQVMDELGYFVRIIAFDAEKETAPNEWRSYFNNSTTNNQAIFNFNDRAKITFQGLNFRSKTEIKIYEALLKKGLLVMPLPVVVMGVNEKYKEPDFVVCYKGKIGILEIHGGPYHPPETAAKEHERRREFTKLGVSVYEIFDSERCWQNPDSVVDDFIQAFTQAR